MKQYLQLALFVAAVCISPTWQQVTIPQNFLLFSTHNRIAYYDLASNSGLSLNLLNDFQVTTIEFDVKHKCLFYYQNQTFYIDKICYNDRNQEIGNAIHLIEVGLDAVRSFSYDWISDLLYFIDTHTHSIKAVTTRRPDKQWIRTIRKFAVDSLPTKIAVDPEHGHLYWVNQTSVVRANLDGTQEMHLVYGESTIQLRSIAVDHEKENEVLLLNVLRSKNDNNFDDPGNQNNPNDQNNHDALGGAGLASAPINKSFSRDAPDGSTALIGAGTVTKLDFKTFNVKDIKIKPTYFNKSSLVGFYRDHIYWSHYVSGNVTISKSGGTNFTIPDILYTSRDTLIDLKVVSAGIQNKTNACSGKHNCEQLCIVTQNKKHKCICADGWKKDSFNVCKKQDILNLCDDKSWECETPHLTAYICIPREFRCNGHKDCPDGSDEKQCGHNNSAKLTTQFAVLLLALFFANM